MGNKYVVIEPIKNNHIQLFSHEKIKEIITTKIKTL